MFHAHHSVCQSQGLLQHKQTSKAQESELFDDFVEKNAQNWAFFLSKCKFAFSHISFSQTFSIFLTIKRFTFKTPCDIIGR